MWLNIVVFMYMFAHIIESRFKAAFIETEAQSHIFKSVTNKSIIHSC